MVTSGIFGVGALAISDQCHRYFWNMETQACNKLLRNVGVDPETSRSIGKIILYTIGNAYESTKLASLHGKDNDIEETKVRAEVGTYRDETCQGTGTSD